MDMNYFAPRSAAERYLKGRPYFHPLVVSKIKEFLSLTGPVAAALDVGCGTGLSTIALKEVALRVVGVDPSEEMVARAPAAPGLTFQIAPAESLPFGAGEFDLLTASSAFHWFDRERFMTEARRVLRPGGRLVIYDNYFSGTMEGNEAFRRWFREEYLARFPSPSRGELSFGEADTEAAGFRLLGRELYENELKFSVEGLVDYLTSHSNVIAAVEGGQERIEDVKSWLAEKLTPFYRNNLEATFLFGGPIWFLERSP